MGLISIACIGNNLNVCQTVSYEFAGKIWFKNHNFLDFPDAEHLLDLIGRLNALVKFEIAR